MALFAKKENSEKAGTNPSPSVSASGNFIPHVLVQPRISEKSTQLSAAGKYVFNVLKSANKVEIKKAVERAYKVRVTQVNVVNNRGKNRTYGRISGRTSGFKKAIVTLKKGDKIEAAAETI